jgi:nucleoside-triphosphatase THEP1
MFNLEVQIYTGILITGPPGSGKTYFVNSVKERISDQYSFMNVDCADLILKVYTVISKSLR